MEPLIKSSAGLCCWQNADGCEARDEGRSQDYEAEEHNVQTPHFAATQRDGTFQAVCFVARLAKGGGHLLRLASRIPSRKAAVATVWNLIRGSLRGQGKVAQSAQKKNAGGDRIIHVYPQKKGRERHARNFIKENEQAINSTLAKNKPARTVPTNHSWLINELGDEA